MKSKFYLILHDYSFLKDIKSDIVEETSFPIYTCFREASCVLKKLENSRFKVFDSREKAIAYAKYHQNLTYNDDENNYNKKYSKMSSVDLKPNRDLSYKDEKPLPFSHPTSSQISQLREYINQNKTDDTLDLYLQNPRLLMSTGDTPVILQEGARYHAIHMCARTPQDKLVNVCAAILDLLGTDLIYQRLYPEDDSTNLYNRKMHLTDLYLNNRDKMLYDTPLHMACKFGNIALVKLLVSQPLVHKFCLNSEGKLCDQVICDRYKLSDKQAITTQIRHILEDNYYVPVLRDVMPSILTKQNLRYFKMSSIPMIGRPFVWNNSSPTLQQKNFYGSRTANDHSHSSDSLFNLHSSFPEENLSFDESFAKSASKEGLLVGKIDALAGPMSYTKASDFFKMCNSARKTRGSQCFEGQHFSDKSLVGTHLTPNDITKTDPHKGLEILGRQLAKSMNIPWAERWDFISDASVPKLAYRDEDTQNFDECLTDISIFNDGEMSYSNPSSQENDKNIPGLILSDVLNFVDVTSPKGLSKLENHFEQSCQTDRIRKSLFSSSFESKLNLSSEITENDFFLNNSTSKSFRSSSNVANINVSKSSSNSSFIIPNSQFLKWRESKAPFNDGEFENALNSFPPVPINQFFGSHQYSYNQIGKIVQSPTLANESNLCTYFQKLSINCPDDYSTTFSHNKATKNNDTKSMSITENSFLVSIFLNVKNSILPVIIRKSTCNFSTLKNLIKMLHYQIDAILSFSKNKHNVNSEKDDNRYYTPPSSPSINSNPVYAREKLSHNISEPCNNDAILNLSPQHHDYMISSTPYTSKKSNDYFREGVSHQSFIDNYNVTQNDFDLYLALLETDIVPHKYPHLARWFEITKGIYKNRKMTPRKWIELDKPL